MSWLYSAALVAEYLGENFLDGEQSAPLNGKPTQQAYCAPDKMMDFLKVSRFGMTFKPLTESLGEELLMSFRADFPVRTLVPQEKAQELTEKHQECGEKWQGSFTKWSQDSCSWKTHQCSLVGDLDEFSETWPQWGLMRDGECWEQLTLEQSIKGIAFGLSLNYLTPPPKNWPTPTATDWKAMGKLETLKRQGNNFEAGGQNRPQYHYSRLMNMKMPVSASEMLMLWPVEWTDLKPLEMGKFQEWRQLHGKFLAKEIDE
jgi:hypothetical protein